jgi:hypothetical protein
MSVDGELKSKLGPGDLVTPRQWTSSNELDARKHDIASTCANVWTAAFHAFGAQLVPKHYPDEGDAEAFLERVSEELHNTGYQLYCYLYTNPESSVFKLTSL